MSEYLIGRSRGFEMRENENAEIEGKKFSECFLQEKLSIINFTKTKRYSAFEMWNILAPNIVHLYATFSIEFLFFCH
jgi:hypothetical protein